MQNLVLGTAQLGMSYGIGNRAGQPDPSRALEIVREARDHGISEFDTAQHYGTSEAVLGEAISGWGSQAGFASSASSTPPWIISAAPNLPERPIGA